MFKGMFLVFNIQFRLVIFTNMENQLYTIIGVMSGTSLDGIDMAIINFTKGEKWKFSFMKTATVPYPLSWKSKLASAIKLDDVELAGLNLDYTHYLAQVISSFIDQNDLTEVDAICSHGHTVKHEPENNFTLQIGNLPQLAEQLKKRVICNFRVQDVELGGQGAPLVPIGDELLFAEYKYCLNLGGFANISTRFKEKRIAYDICAVNTILNFYTKKLGEEFDAGGKIAKSGTLNAELLQKLDGLLYYKKNPPKSLGMEWVMAEVLPILKGYEEDIPSLLHTYTFHIASQIAKTLDNHPSSEVLVTGGGTFNTFLIERIKKMTKTKLIIPSAEIVNFKEALIFGLLGVLRMRDEINVLSSVTGAREDHSAGIIYEV